MLTGRNQKMGWRAALPKIAHERQNRHGREIAPASAARREISARQSKKDLQNGLAKEALLSGLPLLT
jgi:hypothetical protein